MSAVSRIVVAAVCLLAGDLNASTAAGEVPTRQTQESSVSARKKDGSAPQVSKAAAPASSSSSSVNSALPLPAEHLVSLIDQWHAATLRGDEASIKQSYDSLHAFLVADLERSRNQMRSQATAAAYRQPDESPTSSCDESSAKDEEFARCLDLFKCKEMIAGAISRTDAFSNRYRLLGDYADLLRRELGMNRITLASQARPESAR